MLALLSMYTTDMPNSERWLFWEDYFVRIFTRIHRGLISAHMCSYQCWLASFVGDPETRCYFPEQGPRDSRVRCVRDDGGGCCVMIHGPQQPCLHTSSKSKT